MAGTISRKRSLDDYDDSDIKKSKFLHSSEKKETNVNETYLPHGWTKVILSDSTSAVLSPDGRQFQSRLRALQYLIKKKYEESAVEEMRAVLVHEKWRENPLLPEGWKYRKDGEKIIRFIDFQANLISNLDEALGIVERTGDKADIEGLRMFSDISNMESEDTLRTMEEGNKDDSEVLMDETVEVDEDDLEIMDEIMLGEKETVPKKEYDIANNTLLETFTEMEVDSNLEISLTESEIDVIMEDDMKDPEVQSKDCLRSVSIDEIESVVKTDPIKKEEPTVWEPVETLPAGWMCREMPSPDGRGKRLFILSPHGKVFPCRRLALLFMIENEFAEDEIEFMRDMLIHEKWESNNMLPVGWRIRSGDADMKRYEFLSKDCDHFRSFRKALDFMKGSNHFNNEDIANFEAFSSDESKKKRETIYEWADDETLPEGWKSRRNVGQTGKQFYLSPNGEQFPSRRVILQHMIKEGYSEMKKSAMRETLSLDGWELNSNLPDSWLFREVSGKNKNGISVSVFLLSNEGALFKSYKMAVEFMQESRYYNEVDIEKLNMLITEKTGIRRTTLNEWHEDEHLPEGWKWRLHDGKRGKQFFLSPTGEQFPSKKAVLQHLIREGYSEEDLDGMREFLKKDDWESDDHLPLGWLYRETSGRAKAGIHVSVTIFTVEGHLFQSYKKALDFMKENEAYGDKDLDNLKKMIDDRTDVRRSALNDWVEDQSLPVGWKLRHGVGKTGKDFFLAPDGKQFGSRKLCLQYMMDQNYPSGEVEEMRKCLSNEGWVSSTNLPNKWMYKQSENSTASGARQRRFLTDKGVEIKSFLKALEFLMQNDGFTEKDFEGIQIFADEQLTERRIKSDDFTNNESVPPGWRTKMSDGKCSKQLFLSPDGEQFANRRVALQHMLQENFPLNEIETMRNLLKFEGWSSSDNLPDGWMWKQNSSQDQTRTKTKSVQVSILSVEAHLFESYKSAVNFIETSNKYDVEDVENFNDFMSENSNKRRQSMADWKEVNSLPYGWKTKMGGSKQFFISPDGLQFANRRIALKYMLDENHPTIDVEKMRQSLKLENWKENSMLPRNWRYKRDKTGDINYVTSEGDVLSSDISVRKLMEASDDFTADDKEGFRMFTEVECVRRRSSNYEWNTGDSTVPAGWKSRSSNDRKYFLSPDGQQYPCRRAALQQMLKSEYEKEEIEEMRSMLQYEGWEKSEHLPLGWLQKISHDKKHVSVKLLTVEGNMLESYKTAIEYMESLSHYNGKDLLGVQLLMEEKASKRRLVMTDWEDGGSVPKGWKIRIAEGKTKKEFFLAPDGRQFPCRKAGLQHMINEKYPAEEIEEMRRMLRLEGWEINKNLPKGWRIRYSFSKVESTNLSLLSTEGREFKSYKLAIEFMKSSNSYAATDINDLKALAEEKCIGRRQSIKDWYEDETVPAGWKLRIAHGKADAGKQFFLSPAGKQFPCRKAALQFMISENYSEDQVVEMRQLLKYESWEESKYLPENWLYRINMKTGSNGSHAVVFLTSEGKEMKSYSTAIEFVLSDYQNYSDEDVENLKLLREQHSTLKRTSNDRWEENDTVPEGWKVRISEGKANTGKQFFLAPDGRQFPCRRIALKTMIEEVFPQMDIVVMRSKLVYEGWESHDNLPKFWFMKRPSSPKEYAFTFVTDVGDKLCSTKAAIDCLRSRNMDNIEDVDKLMTFSRTIMQTNNTERHQWEDDGTVPDGWKVRRVPSNKPGVGELEIFLTSEGQQIHNRRSALDHVLRGGNHDDEAVYKLRKGMKRFGWEIDPNLPAGFLRRTFKPDAKGLQTQFLSPDNKKFESYSKLLEYLLVQGTYNFDVTGYVARNINWGKLNGPRKQQLQDMMNEQMKSEDGQQSFKQESEENLMLT